MKILKLIQVVGVLTLLFGVAVRAGTGEYYGTVLAVLGTIIYAAARVAAWVMSDKT